MRFLAYAVIAALALYFVNARAQTPPPTVTIIRIDTGDDDDDAGHTLRPYNLRAEYYDTVDQAAIAALTMSAGKSELYEYGGLILRTANGRFRFTEPRTMYRGDSVYVGSTTDVDYPGYYVVADYHTHPCLPYTHFAGVFSDADVEGNRRTNTIGYLATLCYGRVLRYVPWVTAADFVFFPEHPNAIGSRGEEIARIDLGHPPMAIEDPTPGGMLRGNHP